MKLTPEEQSTLDELPIDEQVSQWLSWLRNNIQQLNETPDIDKEKAIRGIIVEYICEDAVNRLMIAIQHTKGDFSEESPQIIKDNLNLTWLGGTQAISEFGHYLPEYGRMAFEEIFQQFEPFVSNVIDNTQLDAQEVKNIQPDFYLMYAGFRDIYLNSPDMSTDDTTYALQVLNPKKLD